MASISISQLNYSFITELDEDQFIFIKGGSNFPVFSNGIFGDPEKLGIDSISGAVKITQELLDQAKSKAPLLNVLGSIDPESFSFLPPLPSPQTPALPQFGRIF